MADRTDGILVVNKPKGMTSHDVVKIVRRTLRIDKVGHAGTLDPQATGVLVLLLGTYTKSFNRFSCFDKEYEATLVLGKKTTSGDISGDVIETKTFSHIDEAMVRRAVKAYVGEMLQTPPMVSALQYKGKRLYELAREGRHVERAPRKIEIKELRILGLALPEIRLYLKCSRGTYVRQLAEDLAETLGSVGCISQLQRLSIGPFSISQALPLEEISLDKVLPFCS